MSIILWGAIALLFFGYFGWILLAIIIRFIFKNLLLKLSKYQIFPTVTLLVSAYNEEAVIEEKVKNCLALDYPREKLQIVFASESTDRTNEIISNYVSNRLLLNSFSNRHGKSATINRVMPSITSEIIIFSDANSMYEKNAIQEIVNNFADSRVGCVIGQLKYIIDGASSGTSGEGLYWALDIKFREAISGIKGLVPGINGSIFAIRRALYFPIAYDRGDDYELCTKIVNKGFIAIFERCAIAYEVAQETNFQQYQRKLRIARWNIKSSTMLSLDAIKCGNYRSLLQIILIRGVRYISPLILLVVFYASFRLSHENSYYLWFFILQMTFLITSFFVLVFNSKIKNKLLNAIGYFLLINLAAMMAWVTILSERSLWTKQR
jgi:cellulose synthase/poly-beta-1,6-N-acetylglucosamine synthase-like glycosyltransferase